MRDDFDSCLKSGFVKAVSKGETWRTKRGYRKFYNGTAGTVGQMGGSGNYNHNGAVREEVRYELVGDFGLLFGVIADQPRRIDDHTMPPMKASPSSPTKSCLPFEIVPSASTTN